jgi:GAF domain-containing protein
MSSPSLKPAAPAVPAALAGDFTAFRSRLQRRGLHEALGFLNGRTPHRFTGVFRFDGAMLRSVSLVDKWDPQVRRGQDIPLAQAYCAVLHDNGDALEVLDSRTDGRFPHMEHSPIASYCGALIRDGAGEPWGALCHYDLQPCQTRSSEMALLQAAATAVYAQLAAAG